MSTRGAGQANDYEVRYWTQALGVPKEQLIDLVEQHGDARQALVSEIYIGAQGRNRTTDTVIFSHVLYQLSYLGAGPAEDPGAGRDRAL